jgi:hypothetical protein
MPVAQPLIEARCHHASENQFAYHWRRTILAARTGIVSDWNDGLGITPGNGCIAAVSHGSVVADR